MKKRNITTLLLAAIAFGLIFAAGCVPEDKPSEKMTGEENLPYEINRIYIAASHPATVSAFESSKKGFGSFIRL